MVSKNLKSKSVVVSVRLPAQQVAKLERQARQTGRTVSDIGAMLIDEGLRRVEFGWIDFRDSINGRRACIQGASLAVWEVIWVARSYDMDIERTAKHLDWPLFKVQAAINYWKAYPDEIELFIKDHESYDFEKLQRMLPQIELYGSRSAKTNKAAARTAKRPAIKRKKK